jgi:hypothetical protein
MELGRHFVHIVIIRTLFILVLHFCSPQTADKLSKDMINLVGNMMLSAGCIAYLGPFTSEFRKKVCD